MGKLDGTLKVSEHFLSIQGEGPQMGRPAVFLRLTACNLLCKWCDTLEVWKKGKRVGFESVLTEKEIFAIENGAHLVITGGEPLLQQNQIDGFVMWLKNDIGFLPFVEIETNGTIMPSKYLSQVVRQWNVSPKLANSGEDIEKFYQPDVIAALIRLEADFKFVVNNEDDYIEAAGAYNMIPAKQFWLMPCADNDKDLKEKQEEVSALAIKYVVNYSNRMHIQIWNKKTGV